MSNYQRKNRRKYSLKVHIVLVTKYRKSIFSRRIDDDLKQYMYDIANDRGYRIIAMETDKNHIHILLEYDATERVCDIIRTLKQESAHKLWSKYYAYLSKIYWKRRILWSDGYFACSIGEASQETIERYIASQG